MNKEAQPNAAWRFLWGENMPHQRLKPENFLDEERDNLAAQNDIQGMKYEKPNSN